MKTTNYDQFKLVKTNRKIGSVERLKKSIEKIGYMDSHPILVNDSFEILDGQHRFLACQELGLPIVYSILKKNGHDSDLIITELNSTQVQWRMDEYIHHYAEKGVPWYVEVREFNLRHKLGISAAVLFCSPTHWTGREYIRGGNNKPLHPDREKLAEFVKSCNGLGFNRTLRFMRAVHTLFRVGKGWQIEKLQKRHMAIPESPNVRDYLRVFANIINRGIHDEENKIAL